MKKSFVIAAAMSMVVGLAQAAVIDDFESGSFSSSWTNTTGASVVSETGNKYAFINSGANQATNTLGGYIGATAGVTNAEFSISFDFRFTDTNQRQMGIVIGGDNDATAGNKAPVINLAYDGADDRFEIYQSPNNGGSGPAGWIPLTGLPTNLVDNTWHSVTIEGYGFTTSFVAGVSVANGTYDITVNGVTQAGLQVYMEGVDNGKMNGFNFNSAYGSNPGFDVDNVVATSGSAGPTVVPNIQSIGVFGGMVSLTWDSEPSVSYSVRGRSSLDSGSWTDVTNGIPSGGTNTSVAVTAAADVQFYSISGE